jgi:hypothetical protein
MSGQATQQQLSTIVSKAGSHGVSGGRDGCRDVGEHVLQATHRLGQHLAGDLHQGFRNVASDIGTSTRDVVSDVRETGAENLEATRDIGMAFLEGFCNLGLALQGDTCAIDLTVAQTGNAIQNDLKDFTLSNVEHQRDILSAVLLQGGKDQKTTLDAARVTEIKVVSEEGKSRATTREESYKLQLGQKRLLVEGRDTREKVRDKIGKADRRAAKATAVILLDACRNEAELRRQIDACCCDLKLLIAEQEEATRTLLLELARTIPPIPPCVDETGTWQPLIEVNPAFFTHTILNVSQGTFTRSCTTGVVSVAFFYDIDTGAGTVTLMGFSDFATLPIPPAVPFVFLTDAMGVSSPELIAGTGMGVDGNVQAVVGDVRIQMLYFINTILDPNEVWRIHVTATYTP